MGVDILFNTTVANNYYRTFDLNLPPCVYKHFYNVVNFRAHTLLTKFGLYLVMQ